MLAMKQRKDYKAPWRHGSAGDMDLHPFRERRELDQALTSLVGAVSQDHRWGPCSNHPHHYVFRLEMWVGFSGGVEVAWRVVCSSGRPTLGHLIQMGSQVEGVVG